MSVTSTNTPMFQCGLCGLKFQLADELIAHVERGQHFDKDEELKGAQQQQPKREKMKVEREFTIDDHFGDSKSRIAEPTLKPSRNCKQEESHKCWRRSRPFRSSSSGGESEARNLVKREQFFVGDESESEMTDDNLNATEEVTTTTIITPVAETNEPPSPAAPVSTLYLGGSIDLNSSHKCLKCPMTFANTSSLKEHRSVHALDCKYCGESFYIKPSLDRHLVERHPGVEGEGTGKGLKVPLITAFASDVLIEAGVGCYHCKICGKSCVARSDMQKHVRRHTDERPYSCIICNDRFKHRSAITNHMRIHTGERPYLCLYCGKQFSQPSNKRRHEALHRGERPFSCILCHRNFSEKTTLQTHMLQHTGERPFRCSHCGKGHITNSALNSHIKSRHGHGYESQNEEEK